MNKPVEEMTDRELLEELIREKRLQERTRNFRIGCRVAVALVVVILLCVYLPPVIRFYRQANETMQQVRDAVGQVRGGVEQVKGASTRVQGTMDELQGTVDSIKDSLTNLKQNGVDVLQGTMDQLNQLLSGFPKFW